MKASLNNVLKKYRLDKKLNKFKKDPNLFITDMVNNKKNQLVNYLPISIKGINGFTIVTAVYNSEDYLDDFFNSIIGQTLSFKNNIFIICVDDGSLDSSAKIIKGWVEKYPNNIQYFYKENGGQASARNLGLKHVKTQWVTFTDPDDYLNKDYFRNIDQYILNHKDIKMMVTNILIYSESEKIIKNTHPLRYRFNENHSFSIKDWKNHLNFSAASTVFDYSLIKESNLKFDERVKPNFEDGKFIADYALEQKDGNIHFLKDSIYYYRKRSDQNSTIDTSWDTVEKFDNVLRYGHLAMLREYQEAHGIVPVFIQRTALYDVAWYVQYLLNENSRTSHLTAEQKETFLNLLHEIFEYIDITTIHAFNLAGIWFKQKVGMLGLFKQQPINNQIIYVENFDKEKKQIKVSFFSYFEANTVVKLNGVEVIPTHSKKVSNTFVGQKIIEEYIMWLPYIKTSDQLEVFVNGHISRISVKGKHHKSVTIKDIFTAMQNYKDYSNDGSWVLMDRDTQADDNAEHLYRYIKKNNLKEDCYFALRKESQDWNRLQNEGFKLLEFGSKEFEKQLRSCDKVISSHLDKYVNNYFGDEYGFTKKFVFLQHGITKDDLSSWFNGKKNLFCLVTATSDEYHSIANSDNYKLTSKEVLLSGFPRHDALYENAISEKLILIMPTWRNNLVGNTIGLGDERPYNAEFENSIYTQKWKSVLADSKLKTLVEKHNYKIIFAPHANITPYLNCFDVPEYIEIWSKTDSSLSIQNLFKKAKFMITDYSSVAFEMAYLGKQTIYYQFDTDEVFSGNHTYKKGYFEYETHGFGPVVYEHEQLLNSVNELLENDGNILDEYLERINQTFVLRDTNNSQRVYDHLIQMDEYQSNEYILEINALCSMLEQAMQAYDLTSLKIRLDYLFNHYEHDDLCKKYLKIYEYLMVIFNEQNQEANVYNKLLDHSLRDLNKPNLDSILNDLNICYQTKNKKKFTQLLKQVDSEHADIDCINLLALAMSEQSQEFITLFNEKRLEQAALFKLTADQINLDLIYLELLIKDADYEQFWSYVKAVEPSYRTSEFKQELQLLKFRVYSATQDLSNSVKEYSNLLKQENFVGILDDYEKYCEALLSLKEFNVLNVIIDDLIQNYPESKFFKNIKIQLLMIQQDYEKIVFLFENESIELDDNKYSVIKSFYVSGNFEKAHRLILRPTLQDSFEYWFLVWEIALQCNDADLDLYCRKHLWAYFPHLIKENLPKINLMLNMLAHKSWVESA